MIAIGLGGNVGSDDEIVARFRRARDSLGGRRSAPLYRSAAIGPDQADYLNTAIVIDDVADVLGRVHAVEAALGRDRARETRWGPRTLDLDVLVWDAPALATPELVVPHPRLAERRFALQPVADLLGEPYRAMLARVADQRVELVAASW